MSGARSHPVVKGRRKAVVPDLRMSDAAPKKGGASGLRFGSAVVKLRKADARDLADNVTRGQAALARAMRVLETPGVKLRKTKGVPLYAADPDRPDHLIRTIDGRRDRGVFENGEFKVIG